MSDIDITRQQLQNSLLEISIWLGCEKEFFLAIDILSAHKRISTTEETALRKGLTCWAEDLVNLRMRELRLHLESELAAIEPEIPVLPEIELFEVQIEEPAKVMKDVKKRRNL